MTLQVANRLWGASTTKFEPDFLRVTREQYQADLVPIDFDQSEQARQTINDWIAQSTSDKIKELIPAGVIDSATRMVLTNAIYFKGDWNSEFDSSKTLPRAFQLSGMEHIEVPTMNQMKQHMYFENEDMQMVALPYKERHTSMIIVLPRKTDGLAELERTLTLERFNEWVQQMQAWHRVDGVALPSLS